MVSSEVMPPASQKEMSAVAAALIPTPGQRFAGAILMIAGFFTFLAACMVWAMAILSGAALHREGNYAGLVGVMLRDATVFKGPLAFMISLAFLLLASSHKMWFLVAAAIGMVMIVVAEGANSAIRTMEEQEAELNAEGEQEEGA